MKTHLLSRMLVLLFFGMSVLTGLDLFVSGADSVHPNRSFTQTAQAQLIDTTSTLVFDEQGEFIEIAMDPPGAGEGEFLVSNFATARVFNNFLWRGYAFRPSRDVEVTGIYGGWGNPASCTATEFYGAIFEGILTDGELTSEDGAVPQVRMQSLVSSVRFDDQLEDPVPAEVFVPFENTITLQRGVLYILAQGSADRGVNCHVSASDLDVNNLIAGSPLVSEWLPAINKAFSFPDIGTPESVVNLNAEGLSDAMPLLGLRYETDVELPGVTTGAGLAIDTDRAIVNGTLDNTGAAASSDETTLFVEYGTGSDLSGSDTRLEQITPSQLKGEATGVPISATLEDLEAGETYYFRMVAVNEAGRTSGDIVSFEQTPVANVSVISAEVSFGGTVIPNVQAVASGGTTSFQLFADPSFFLSETVTGTCPAVVADGSFDGTTFTTGAVPGNTECTLQFEFFQLRPQITRAVPGTDNIAVEFEAPRVDEVPEGEEPGILRHEYSFDGEIWVSIEEGNPEANSFTIEGLSPGPEYRLRIRTILSRDEVEEPSISSDILPVVLFEDGDGTPGDPFIITNRFQLNSVRFLLDKNFELGNDIDFDAEDFEEGGAFFNSGLLWVPIGSETDPFTGTFDGKGFTIDNLRSLRGLQDYIGLFAKVEGVDSGNKAVVKNLSVRGNISGYRYVGGIAGMISTDVQAERLFYSGRVTGDNPLDTRVGGIAGVLASDLSHSGFAGNLVRSNGNKAGGLAGKLVNANISHSYVQGEVTGPTTSRGSFGGLVGYVQATDPVEISYSYFSGDLITGNNSTVGFEGVGGLVGRMDNSGESANTLTFTQVYAAGQVSTGTEEDPNSGGLVGFDGGATINADGAFWDKEGTGQDASGIITGGTGTPIPLETTAQAKLLESYDAWGDSGADIAETGDDAVTDSRWILYNQASYPYLRSNTPENIPGLDLAARFASGSNAIWGDAQTWTVFGCPAGESVTYPRSSLPASDALVTLCDETSLNIEADRSVTVSQLIMGSETSVQVLPFGTLSFSGEDLTSTLPSGTSITVNSNANAFVQADKTLAVDEDASFTVKTDGYFLSSGTVNGAITHERVLSGPDRWLLMSSPVTGTRFAAESTDDPLALLAPLFTRGFPGSDLPNAPARSANVLLYDESLSGDRSDRFAPPSTNELPSGKGFMVRTSSENPVNGVMQEISYPLTLSVSGSVPQFNAEDNFTFSVSYSASEPDEPESGWNLLGNPFAFGLNWAATGSSSNPAWLNRQMLNGFVYLYNPETQRYMVSSSSAADNDPNLDVLFSPIISPFQGFWVKSNNSTNTEFQMGEVAFNFGRTNNTLFKESSTEGYRPLAASENSVLLRFSTPQTDSSYAMIRFAEEFTETFGDQDAYFLTPLADTFSWLHSDKEGRATLINSQPFVNDQESLTVPLLMGGFIGEQLYDGEAMLEWDLGEGTADMGGIYLVDHQKGKRIDMQSQQSYAFEIERQVAKMHMERTDLQQAGTPVMKSTATGDARFELFVDGVESTGMTQPDLPDRTELLPNHPNPFNPTTTIQYTMPEPGAVRLEVYTITGQRVAVLVDEAGQPAGRHSVVFDAGHLASGLYLYRLQAGNTIQTRKMMLIK